MKPNILIVDDDRLFLEQCLDMLMDIKAELYIASSGKEALEMLSERHIDLMILDLILSDMNGEIVMEKARNRYPDMDVIIVTGFATVESVVKFLRKGVFDYLKKPIVIEEFKFAVSRCLKERSILAENKKLKEHLFLYELGKILNSSLELSKVYDNILVALTNYIPSSSIIIVNADISSDCDIKAFAGFDRNYILKIKSDLLSYVKNPNIWESKEHMQNELFFYDPKILSEKIEKNNFEEICVININNKERNGFIFIFSKKISDEKKEGLKFLRQQTMLALEHSLSYLNAQELAYIDDLTKVYNIRYLYVALDNEIKRAERFSSCVSVLFIDLDFFKRVNDTYGHLVGSKLLIEFANEIKKSVRGIDSVIRYGGDEFVVICTETDTDLAFKVAERIRKRTEECDFLKNEGYSIHITATIGIATYPVHGNTKTILIEKADKAMYRGKECSRNIVCVAE